MGEYLAGWLTPTGWERLPETLCNFLKQAAGQLDFQTYISKTQQVINVEWKWKWKKARLVSHGMRGSF